MHLTRLLIPSAVIAGVLSACTSAPVTQEPKETATNVAPSEAPALEATAPAADPVAKKGMGVADSSAQGAKPARKDRKPAHHRWEMYRWAIMKSPSTLPIANCLSTPEWSNHFRKAAKDWNSPRTFGAQSTPLLNRPMKCQMKKQCIEAPGTTTVCNGEYGENGWLGLATIYIQGDYIVQGLAQMNDTYFKSGRYDTPNEKRHVMCQEVAHTFGLGHQSVDGSSQNSCMDYFPNIDENADSKLSTRPNLHDFEELNEIYADLENFTTLAVPARGKEGTAGALARSGEEPAGLLGRAPARNRVGMSGVPALLKAKLGKTSKDPKTWGKLKSQSNDGRGSVYEKLNTDGSTILTHVYWTKEASEKCPTCDHRDHDHDHDH
jgi:hypothetical protein